MLSRSRLALSLCGLALVVPAVPVCAAPDDGQPAATAQPAIGLDMSSGTEPSAGYQPSMGYQPSAGYQPSSPAAPVENQPTPAKHHHKGLFGWKHCVECQRARVKAHDGVEIPPPPSPSGMIYQGQVISTSPVIVGDPHGMIVNGSQETGYTVVGPGGPEDMTGYAVVGGPAPSAEPAPIGLARGGQNPWADPRMAAMAPRPGGAGPYDPSVVPSSMPPAQSAVAGPGHDRPHIISHILGLPLMGTHRRQREEREREKHAAIAYGDPKQKVTELPSSMVYGKDGAR